MAYSLRLPDALDAAARAKADYLGISLNALLCVALDAYLRAPVEQPAAPHAGAAPVISPPSRLGESRNATAEPAAKLTRAQKQANYEREKAQFKRFTGQK